MRLINLLQLERETILFFINNLIGKKKINPISLREFEIIISQLINLNQSSVVDLQSD